MRGSEFVFDYVNELHYKLHKVDLNRGRSYIDSPKWLKNKKATVNPENMNDDRCFQYAITVALHCGKIKKHPERINNITPFIDQYDWTDISFPSHFFHKQIRHADKSKYNLNRENQVNLLMITDGTKLHYLFVKTLSGLLRGITGNNHGDFYSWSCLL